MKQLKVKQNNKKSRFLGMLLATLNTSLLGNLLTGKGVMRAGDETSTAIEGTIRVRQDF